MPDWGERRFCQLLWGRTGCAGFKFAEVPLIERWRDRFFQLLEFESDFAPVFGRGVRAEDAEDVLAEVLDHGFTGSGLQFGAKFRGGREVLPAFDITLTIAGEFAAAGADLVVEVEFGIDEIGHSLAVAGGDKELFEGGFRLGGDYRFDIGFAGFDGVVDFIAGAGGSGGVKIA